MMEVGLVKRETWEGFSPLSAPNQSYQKTEGFLTTQAGWLKTKRPERKAERMERKQSEWNIKNIRGQREGKRAWCMNEGGGARHILWEKKKRWRRVGKRDVESGSASPLCLCAVVIMKKFQGERAQSKPEVTERRDQANKPPLPSLLPSFLLSLHLYRVCGSDTSTLLSLLGPLWVRVAHVCRQAGNVRVFERQRRCNLSEWKSTRDAVCLHIV